MLLGGWVTFRLSACIAVRVISVGGLQRIDECLNFLLAQFSVVVIEVVFGMDATTVTPNMV